MNGLFLLKKGGKLVYSTCSLNPIENEAVVNTVLNLTDNKIKILDFQIENFRTRPALTDWYIKFY